jgi:hypothetical protein
MVADNTTPVPTGTKGYTVDSASWWWAYDEHEPSPELRWPRNIEIYDRMRRQDAQVASVLRAVMLPIRRTTYRIDPAGAPARVVNQIADDLGLPIVGRPGRKTKDTPFRFGEHVRLALLKLVFGFSYFEKVFDVRPDGVNGALVAHLADLQWRPPRTISEVDVNPDGSLKMVHQWGIFGQESVAMEAERLVAYVNDREGGNWLGQSMLRPAYKYWLLKDRLLRVQAQTVDRNGLGFPVYTNAPPAEGLSREEADERQKVEREAGERLARGARSGDNAGAALPNGAKFGFEGVSGVLPDASVPIRYYDAQIASAVLANFLNLGGDDSTGSYALGDTFESFFTMSLQTVAQEFADAFTNDVIAEIVRLNYPPGTGIPRLTFDEIGSKHNANAQDLFQLKTGGVLTMDDPLEAFIRNSYGLPPMDPSTARTAANDDAEAAAAGTDPSSTPDTSGDDSGTNDGSGDDEGNDA